MAKTDSPLVAAAAAFAEELATYSRLGDLFLRTQLDSLKHLERAKDTLQQISDSEQRLQQAGQALIGALGEARQEQEQLSPAVINHAPNVRARNETLGELMALMGQLASDTQPIRDNPDDPENATRVMELSQRASDLSKKCSDADFKDLSEQVHALHQRLKAVGEKLQKTTPN